jgi:hypothetical protein
MERLLDTPVADVADLGTSHDWSLRRVTLADGRKVFVKEARRRIDGLFAAEAAGLRWLRDGRRQAAGAETPGEKSREKTPDGEMPGEKPSGGETPEAKPSGEEAFGPVPEVLAVDDTTLVLPWIECGSLTPEAAERFGRELAVLHGAGEEAVRRAVARLHRLPAAGQRPGLVVAGVVHRAPRPAVRPDGGRPRSPVSG